jgi:hypothetical protein
MPLFSGSAMAVPFQKGMFNALCLIDPEATQAFAEHFQHHLI